MGEIIQAQDKNPIINPVQPNSTSKGSNAIAKTLGMIADRSMSQATDYASEASKANLLQTHSMIQDVEAQSKLDILKSPGHAETIAQNAEGTIAKIKSGARVNRGDRQNLDYMASSTLRGLKLTAAEKSITLARESAKDTFLTSVGDTLQSLRRDIHVNPEQADALVEAQYEAIHGQVRAGILTAHEAQVLHKQFTTELSLAHELVQGIKDGVISASELSAYHSTEPGNVQMSNASLPINHETAMNSEHHYGQMTNQDLMAKASSGGKVTTSDLMGLKDINAVDNYFNYAHGVAKANGDINSAKNWNELKGNLDNLNKKKKLSTQEEGYKNRLSNFFNDAEKPGAYQNFIAGTPEGARTWQNYVEKETVNNKRSLFGSEKDVARQRAQLHVDNYNDLISKHASIGIGMNYPDNLRQPIPLAHLAPIVNGFEKDGDINSAINNIQVLTPQHRIYAMNAFPENPRKQLTVYEIGTLSNKAEPGFLSTLMRSQQVDALGEKPGQKDAQEKFQQLDSSKEGYSDAKLRARVSADLGEINTYLVNQPNGGDLVSAKTDQALRYLKQVAVDHNDYQFKHLNDYLKTYTDNMKLAYGAKTGFNYVMDTNNVPLEDNQMQILASHGINVVREKLLKYKTPAEVDHIFASTPPIMVSSPGGRITVIDSFGRAVPDENGHPAFNKIYTPSVYHHAELDTEARNVRSRVINPLFGSPVKVEDKSPINYLRGKIGGK